MLEFMDGECVRLARDVGGADIADAGALLMIEADGDDATVDAAAIADFARRCIPQQAASHSTG